MSKQWMPAKFTALVLLISPISIAHAQSALDSYLAEGLANNQALQARTLDARAALAELDRARAERKPVLKLEARYLLSEGGRSIDFPAGDLLNPVYATLNGLTANSSTPTRFPQLENQSFDLLREHEQDTRIKLSAPLFAPGLDAAIRAAAAQADSAEAEREVAARTLIRDIRQAYYGYGQAQAALGVLQASSTVLTENVRVNNALVDSGKATRDAPLRAQAELLAIEDRSSTVQNQLDAAARYLNFLVRRPLDTPVPAAAPEPLNSLATPTAKERPELRALSASVRAAQAATDAERARAKPTLAFGIDAGIQGEQYRFGRDANFVTAALVLNWTLFDFGAIRHDVAAAQARSASLVQRRDALREQLALLTAQAQDNVRTARARVNTSAARFVAADESFRIASRKRAAGALTQIEFLDAERARTEADLARISSQFDLANQQAELELALGAYPLPSEFIAR